MNQSSIKNDFNQPDQTSAKPRKSPRKKAPPPLSLRLTQEERDKLTQDAGSMSLSAYIRQKLFGAETAPRQKRYLQKQKQPKVDYIALAQLLGQLGQSELATSMLALAMAAQSGALPVSEELEEDLHTACDHIQEMRSILIVALGLKSGTKR